METFNGLVDGFAVVFTAERIGTLPTADLPTGTQIIAGVVAGFGR